MALEACYVFTPSPSDGNDGAERPTKRRKTGKARARPKEPATNFSLLLDGQESKQSAALRQSTFEEVWAAREGRLNRVLDDASSDIANRVHRFILDSRAAECDDDRLPTGVVAASLASTASGSLFPAIAAGIGESQGTAIVNVPASQCTSLKASLRSIIRLATQQDHDESDDEPTTNPRRGLRLNYDLQLLHDWARKGSLQRVVLFFQGCQSIDAGVLAELIDILDSWQDRIPFVLVLEIATSLELFESQLPRQTLSLLSATIFEAKSAMEVLDVLFRAATDPDDGRPLWLGPSTSKLLLDRQTEHAQSAGAFISSLKYMYLMHFFNNPLSVLFASGADTEISKAQCQAVRDLPSLQKHVRALLDEGDDAEAAQLLKSNPHLESVLPSTLEKTSMSLVGLYDALKVLSIIHVSTGSKAQLTWSSLYTKAMAGELAESPLVRELCLSVKKTPSDSMIRLLETLSLTPGLDLTGVTSSLKKLIAKSNAPGPLRTEHDEQRSTLRTTVVQQKVSLSKHKESLSGQDAEYSKLVNRIDLELRGFFTKHLIRPKDLLLHEVLIFDSKSACRDALGPAPRQAVERALSSPHDYLSCDCCEGKEGLTATQPATAILYQMYLESGSVINLADLWAAFQAIMESDKEGEEEGKANEVLALFHRSLAELRYLTMIKNTRKKADHVAKLKWKGL